MERAEYLFVDGGCLRSICERVSEEYFRGEKISINYKRLGHGFLKVFYYDCLPPKRNNQSDEDYKKIYDERLREFNDIRKINGFHVSEGYSRHRKKIVEQKTVDVSIAVDMLTHTFMKNMQKATLLTSDLDFLPLINALVLQGMYVNLWYHEGHTNEDLIIAADSHEAVTVSDIYFWSSLSFQANHSIPYNWKSLHKEIEGLNKIDDLCDDEFEVYKNDLQEYIVIRYSEGIFHHFQYGDLDTLKKFLKEIS
jgi:uncharacterized LabA/DUF88 family protein